MVWWTPMQFVVHIGVQRAPPPTPTPVAQGHAPFPSAAKGQGAGRMKNMGGSGAGGGGGGRWAWLCTVGLSAAPCAEGQAERVPPTRCPSTDVLKRQRAQCMTSD